MTTVLEQVVDLIITRFGWAVTGAETGPHTRLREDLDLDSLHLVELQVAVEDRFGVRFDPTDEQLLDAFSTVGSLDAYVRHLLEEDR
jgi:acyl carrier protein